MSWNKLMRLLFIGMILAVYAPEIYAKPLIIAGIKEVPLRFYDDNNIPRGIDVEIISHILSKMKIDYEIWLLDSSARLEKEWKSANSPYDIVFTYSYKPERTQYLDYPKESHIHISHHFFILKKNEGKIVFNTYKDLKGFTIGATEGFSYTEKFWNSVEKEKLQLDKIPQRELQIKKLLMDRIDLAAVPTVVTLYEAKQGGYLDKITYLPKPVKSKPYYNTFVKVSKHPRIKELIGRYDEEIRTMKKDGTLKSIFKKYGVEPYKF